MVDVCGWSGLRWWLFRGRVGGVDKRRRGRSQEDARIRFNSTFATFLSSYTSALYNTLILNPQPQYYCGKPPGLTHSSSRPGRNSRVCGNLWRPVRLFPLWTPSCFSLPAEWRIPHPCQRAPASAVARGRRGHRARILQRRAIFEDTTAVLLGLLLWWGRRDDRSERAGRERVLLLGDWRQVPDFVPRSNAGMHTLKRGPHEAEAKQRARRPIRHGGRREARLLLATPEATASKKGGGEVASVSAINHWRP